MTKTPTALLAELRRHGVEPVVRAGRLKLRAPTGRITSELIKRVRQNRAAVLAHLEEQARAETLTILSRLRTFALPSGRMPAARAIALRLGGTLAHLESNGASTAEALVSILAALREVEQELLALGAAADPVLEAAISEVKAVFPGARLTEIRRKESLS